MPAEHLEPASDVLRCSVDELLGRSGGASIPDHRVLRFPQKLYEELDRDEQVIFAYEARKTIADIISQRPESGKLDRDV